MLIAAQSTTAGQDHLAVVYDHDPTPIFALFAKAIAARDPYGVIPPDNIKFRDLIELAMTPAVLGQVHADVVARAMDRNAAPKSADPVVDFGRWLSIGPAIALPRGYLFREDPGSRRAPVAGVSGSAMIPGATRAPIVEALRSLSDLDVSDSGRWPGTWVTRAEDNTKYFEDDDVVRDIALITLWGRFERIRGDAHYSGAIEVPNGSSKERYAEAVRVQRVYALLAVLKQSIRVAELRERAAWYTSPVVQPMLDFASPTLKEELQRAADAVLKMPVHPWIAQAERMRLPAKRYTQYASASYTIGAARLGLFSQIRRTATVRGDGGAFAGDIREQVLGEIDREFLPAVEREMLMRQMLDTSDVVHAESVLGLTTPGAPPTLHLHGETWRALVQTGNMASEAVPDYLALMTRPRFPLVSEPGTGGAGTSDLVGNISALSYVARFWTTGENGEMSPHPTLKESTNLPPLYIEPDHPITSEGHTLYQLTPEMLRPKAVGEYFGDEDAHDAEYSLEGVARLLGYADATALLQMPGIRTRLSHLFIDGGATGLSPRPLPGVTRIFHSSRTRKPWKVAVPISSSAMPRQVIALNARTAPVLREIQAVVLRTFESPSLPASTEPLADDTAKLALATLGLGAQ